MDMKQKDKLKYVKELDQHISLYKQMEDKFLNGKKEHNNDLDDMTAEQLVEEALDEAIDQVFYLNKLKQKICTK